jgi:hypothetical protein
MTNIPLNRATIGAYVGCNRFNSCREISRIHLEYDSGHAQFANVEAWIPASTSPKGNYKIIARVASNGSHIVQTGCTCPVGHMCKHINKVLCRLAGPLPIGGPDQHTLQERARKYQAALRVEHASVYMAIACKSEFDSGSDYNRSNYIKENYDKQILGIFFSLAAANACAKAHRNELCGGDDEEDDDLDIDDDDDDDDDLELFCYDGSDDHNFDDQNGFDKVWVERRAIQDASRDFHR